MVRLTPTGFVHEGRAIHPVGFNYTPAEAGCEIWSRWNAGAIDRDFAEIAARGFNVVRVFTFWRDFEPDEGRFDEEAFRRLRELAALAHAHGLFVIPSIVSVLHLLHVFDPPWRSGRDLFDDPAMLDRARAYAAAIAQALSGAPNVLAYDVHDEQYNLDVARAAATPPDVLARWHAAVTAGIRSAHPGVAVLQSLDHQAVTAGLPFRPDGAEAYDLLGVHAYPQWTPFAIESVDAYKATLAPAFLVAITRAFRPAMIDELGLVGASDARVAGYIRAAAASAHANGAVGTVAWCWQDAATVPDPPFTQRPWLGRFGLKRIDGTPKPAMGAFEAFAAQTRRLAGSTVPPATAAIYVPDDFNPVGMGSKSRDGVCLFYAFALAKRAHLPVEFARDGLSRYRLVIAPSMRLLTSSDTRRLRAFVESGGTLLYSTRETLDAIDDGLLGVELDDFMLAGAGPTAFSWNGQAYPVDWAVGAGAGATVAVVRTTTATVLAAYDSGPALTHARIGRGEVFFLNAAFEAQLETPGRLTAHPWHALYSSIAAHAGIRPPLTCGDPDVELALLDGESGRCALAINHGPSATRIDLRDDGGRPIAEVDLDAKGVERIDIGQVGGRER
ncbi:MAG: beta-galactosidase trimerization domain-containing protein [Vicinamibacterales bacterium]